MVLTESAMGDKRVSTLAGLGRPVRKGVRGSKDLATIVVGATNLGLYRGFGGVGYGQ